jgi:hypothetical protein
MVPIAIHIYRVTLITKRTMESLRMATKELLWRKMENMENNLSKRSLNRISKNS